MWRAQRSKRLSAEYLAQHVEQALLYRRLHRRYVEGHVDQGLGQFRRELAGKDGIENGLHVLAQSLTHGDRQATHAVKDRVYRAALASRQTEALADVNQHAVEVRRYGALDRVRHIADGEKGVVTFLFPLQHL